MNEYDALLNSSGWFDTAELQKYILQIQPLKDILISVKQMTLNEYNELYDKSKG